MAAPNPSSRKKRTKFIGIKPIISKPSARNQCTECHKTFVTAKALYGHMRCHPDRPWRGINPPPNFCLTEEDHELATCLLMLANCPPLAAPEFDCTSHKNVYAITNTDEEGCNVCFRVEEAPSRVCWIDLNLAPPQHDDSSSLS